MNYKKVIGNNPFLYSVLQMFKYRHDEKYISLIRGLRDNPNIICMHPGEQYFKRPVCLIQAGGYNDGFFACVRWALDGLFFCQQYGFEPVLKFSDESLYKDSMFPESMNAFEYYFEQPGDISLSKLASHGYIEYSGQNRLLAESLNGGVTYMYTKKYVEVMASVMAQYLRFNKKTIHLIEQSVEKRRASEKVLGVHIRGTDYKVKYKGHPQYVSPEYYFPYIENAMSKHGFEKLFLASDDQNIVRKFREQYDDSMFVYDDKVIRGNGFRGIHTSDLNHYQLGLDVICDMATLSHCGGIVSGLSQVGLIARIYKKSRNEKFLYDEIINKGINKSGKAFSVK